MHGLLQREWVPSDGQIAKYQRYVDAAMRPQSVISDLSKGKMSVEGVEALKACWPRMYADVQQRIIDLVSENKKTIDYKTRRQLSLLLGDGVDGTMNKGYIHTIQKTYAPQNMADNARNGIPQAKPVLSDISKTRAQKLEE